MGKPALIPDEPLLLGGAHGYPRFVTTASDKRQKKDLPPTDLAVAEMDPAQKWPSTVKSTQAVPPWHDLQEDEEAQAALREVGLA